MISCLLLDVKFHSFPSFYTVLQALSLLLRNTVLWQTWLFYIPLRSALHRFPENALPKRVSAKKTKTRGDKRWSKFGGWWTKFVVKKKRKLINLSLWCIRILLSCTSSPSVNSVRKDWGDMKQRWHDAGRLQWNLLSATLTHFSEHSFSLMFQES